MFKVRRLSLFLTYPWQFGFRVKQYSPKMMMPKHNLFISGTTTTVRQADLSEYRPDRAHVFI